MSDRYLGMRTGDLEGKAYARFWNPELAPLPADVREAIARGPVAGPLLPALADAPRVLEAGAEELRCGYGLTADGSLRVALTTELPRVSPAMIDWWFGWHSDEPQRYKLWHPQAHVHASWHVGPSGGATGRDRYVGCTSCVDEYLGSQLGRYLIRFVPPESLGFDARRLADSQQATSVCARVGFAGPLDFGYLVHDVVRTAGGSVMRSRFWVGGPHVQARRGGVLGQLAIALLKRVLKPKPSDGEALLVHCSQEMSHLATFLPDLYRTLGSG